MNKILGHNGEISIWENYKDKKMKLTFDTQNKEEVAEVGEADYGKLYKKLQELGV